MVLQALTGDRLDLTVVNGAKNIITVALWNIDTDGVRIPWDEDPVPTVLAQVRTDFAAATTLMATWANAVETPSVGGSDTLTITFTLDLTAGNVLTEPANTAAIEPVVQVGYWDFRVSTSGGSVLHPVWGALSMRRRISRA